MLTRKKLIKLFALLMVVSLLISACDRPLPSSDEPTPTADTGYPATGEEGAPSEQEPVDTPEPTREVIEEGETTGETGEETTGEPAETGEEETAGEPEAEGGEGETAGEPEAEGGEGETAEEAATPEVMAEGETGEEEAETPSEETPAEGEGEAEGETAETPEETAEGEEAEAAEETAPEEAEEAPAETAEEAGETAAQPLPATHTVAAGENLYRIGLQYNISWVAITEYNGIKNPDRIYVGQVLQIPGGTPDNGAGGQPEPVPTPMGVNYVVKPGDTLFKIGQRFGVSVTEIAEANGLVNPNQIYAGQTLKIPVDAPTPPQVVHHVVQSGETLFRISLQYGVSWLAIARANNIHPPYIIYAGQTLVIPGGNH